MKTDDELDALVGTWILEVGSSAHPTYLADVLAVTRTSPQRSAFVLRLRGTHRPLPSEGELWRPALVLLAVLLVAALALAAVVGSRRPNLVPGPLHRNGAIVYDVGGVLYQASPDGSDPVRLTSSDRFSGEPVFSPDGSLLAYSDFPAYESPGVHGSLVIRSMSDGHTIRVDVGAAGGVALPCFCEAWSPDGSRLLFAANVSLHGRDDFGSLWVVNSDGTSLRRIDLDALEAWNPAWAPDGNTIAFTGRVGRGGDGNLLGPAGVFTMGLDGTSMRRVAAGTWGPIQWLPGGHIAYYALDGTVTDTWVVSADGSGARRLTSGPASNEQKRVSPDGKLAAVTQTDFYGFHRLLLVRTDGSGERVIDASGFDPHLGYTWSPDGTKLLVYLPSGFALDGSFEQQAALLDLDGGARVWLPQLTGRLDIPNDYQGTHAWQALAP